MGTISLKTDRLDLDPEEIFLRYQQYPTVKAFLRRFDDTAGTDAPYLTDTASREPGGSSTFSRRRWLSARGRI